MNTTLLSLLRTHQEAPLSGEEIAHTLGVSRTAVWKKIQVLKKEGYQIEAVNKKGYLLTGVSEKVLPEEILGRLKTKKIGQNVIYRESVTSTNELCKQVATQGAPDGTVCVAEEQTGGKGRLSRGWLSPKGKGVWFSVLLKPTFLPQEASKCTLLAAVAVVQAVNSFKGVHASIKWPNDILLNGKKMVGILTEMSAEFGHINYIVIGIGINVSVLSDDVPIEFRDSTISLNMVAEEKVDRVELLVRVLANLEKLYDGVLKNGFASVLQLWKKHTSTLGKEVKVIAPNETYLGKALDIDEEGLLIVEKEDGTLVKVLAGDVSIRSPHKKGSKYSI